MSATNTLLDVEQAKRIKTLSTICAVAVGLALIGVCFGIWSGFDANKKILATSAGQTPILVAANTIERGHTITPEDLVIESIPSALCSAGALKDTDAESVIGRFAQTQIPQGTQLTDSFLSDSATPQTLACALNKGMCAITIATDEATGCANLLQREDIVSVLSSEKTLDGDTLTTEVVPHARVLALSSSLTKTPETYTSVTLEVTPEEAKSLLGAQDSSRISLVLQAIA